MIYTNLMEIFNHNIPREGLEIYAVIYDKLYFGKIYSRIGIDATFNRKKKRGTGFLKNGIQARKFKYFLYENEALDFIKKEKR